MHKLDWKLEAFLTSIIDNYRGAHTNRLISRVRLTKNAATIE